MAERQETDLLHDFHGGTVVEVAGLCPTTTRQAKRYGFGDRGARLETIIDRGDFASPTSRGAAARRRARMAWGRRSRRRPKRARDGKTGYGATSLVDMPLNTRFSLLPSAVAPVISATAMSVTMRPYSIGCDGEMIFRSFTPENALAEWVWAMLDDLASEMRPAFQ